MSDQEKIESEVLALEKKIAELKDSATTVSTWGLFLALLAIVALLIAIILALEAATGGTITPAVLAILGSLITTLLAILNVLREKGILRIVESLKEKLDRLREGHR